MAVSNLNNPNAKSQQPQEETQLVAESSSDFHSDRAVAGDGVDEFNRRPFAKQIARTIASGRSDDSLVIAIHGPWGDGKTTVLNFIAKELEEQPNTAVVRFNPWYFRDEPTLIASFFEVLATSLGGKLTTKTEDIGKELKKYGNLASALSLSGLGIFGVDPGKLVSSIGDQLSTVELEQTKVRLEELLKKSNTFVVILIDDLDRLEKNEIHALLKLVKLTADFKFTRYVLAFDEDVVAAAIGERYGSGDASEGKRFLEKIVQISLALPVIGEDTMWRYAVKQLNTMLAEVGLELSQEQQIRFGRTFAKAFLNELSTPRSAKLYANALRFAFPMLQGEVDPVDLMLVEGIRLFFPDLYHAMRRQPEIFLGANLSAAGSYGLDQAKEYSLSVVKAAVSKLDEAQERATFSVLEELLPRLGTIFKHNYQPHGSDFEPRWRKEKRLASKDYYLRYFSYGVPSGDISDQEIEQLLNDFPSLSVEDIKVSLSSWLASQATTLVIQKLRNWEGEIASPQNWKLVAAIAAISPQLPVRDGMMSFLSTHEQAAIFCSRLTQNMPTAEAQMKVAREAINAAPTPRFAISFLRWLSYKPESEKTQPSVLSDVDIATLNKEAAEGMVSRFFKSDVPVYKQEDGLGTLYFVGRVLGERVTEDYLKNRFQAEAKEASSFLRQTAMQWISLDTGLPSLHDLEDSTYEQIAAIINPGVLLEYLSSATGEDLKQVGEYPRNLLYMEMENPNTADVLLARQFAFLHQHSSSKS